AVQGGEQPGLYSRSVTQLVAFRGPNVKRLLSQVAGVCLDASEAKRESIQRLVVLGYDLLKVVRFHSGLVTGVTSEIHGILSTTSAFGAMGLTNQQPGEMPWGMNQDISSDLPRVSNNEKDTSWPVLQFRHGF